MRLPKVGDIITDEFTGYKGVIYMIQSEQYIGDLWVKWEDIEEKEPFYFDEIEWNKDHWEPTT